MEEPSASVVSSFTRAIVLAREEEKCWLCRGGLLDIEEVAHLIAASNNHKVCSARQLYLGIVF